MSTPETPNYNQADEDNFDRFDPKHFEADAKSDYRFGALGRAALMLTRGRGVVLEIEKVKAREWADKAKQASENRAPLPGQASDEGLFEKPYSHREAQTAAYNSFRTEDLEPVEPAGYQTPKTDRRSLTAEQATNIGAGLFSQEEIQHGLGSDLYGEDQSNQQKDYDKAA